MPEQLQYQRKLNEWKAAKKAAGGDANADAGKKNAEPGSDGFKELTPAELGKMGMAE